jgi:hypothetical protein
VSLPAHRPGRRPDLGQQFAVGLSSSSGVCDGAIILCGASRLQSSGIWLKSSVTQYLAMVGLAFVAHRPPLTPCSLHQDCDLLLPRRTRLHRQRLPRRATQEPPLPL